MERRVKAACFCVGFIFCGVHLSRPLVIKPMNSCRLHPANGGRSVPLTPLHALLMIRYRAERYIKIVARHVGIRHPPPPPTEAFSLFMCPPAATVVFERRVSPASHSRASGRSGFPSSGKSIRSEISPHLLPAPTPLVNVGSFSSPAPAPPPHLPHLPLSPKGPRYDGIRANGSVISSG